MADVENEDAMELAEEVLESLEDVAGAVAEQEAQEAIKEQEQEQDAVTADIPSTGAAENGRPARRDSGPIPRGEWTTFAKRGLEAPMQRTPLQRQLEDGTEPVVIGCLLDEDDIIQEFETGSPQLLDLLSTPESVRVLLHLITRGITDEEDSTPDVWIQENRRPLDQILRRRPLIAQGLMTSQSSSCDRLLNVFEMPEGAELFDLLWSFFEQPPSQMAPVLAGYTCSTAATLLGKRPTQVTEHLRQRDTSRLFDQFLSLMESKSCVELLACLLYAEDESKLVFPVEGLAAKLVACFDLEADLEAPVLEHAVWLVNVLVARSCMGVLCVGHQILQQFSSPELVTRLIEQVLSTIQPQDESGAAPVASPVGSAAAASVLGILVYHTHLLMQDPLLPVRTPDLRPASSSQHSQQAHQSPPPPPPPAPPPPLPLGTPDESSGEGGEQTANGQEPPSEEEPREDASDVQAAECSAQDSPQEESDNVAGAEGVDEYDEVDPTMRVRIACGAALVNQIVAQMPRLCAVLDAALERRPGSRATATVLEVVCLLSQLLKTGRDIVFQAASDLDLLPKCLQMLFHFPWSTLLHNALRSVINEFVNNREQGFAALLALIARSDLMQRVADEVGSEAEARNAGHRQRSRPRVGYLGHLRILCEDLAELGKMETEVSDALSQATGWKDVILPEIEFVQRLQNASGTPQAPSAEGSPNGTGDASEFDCISAVRTAMANLTEELDLSLEDLRDLDEEMTASAALEMASAHHARRRERGQEDSSRQAIESEELKLLGAVMEAVKIELEVEGCAAAEEERGESSNVEGEASGGVSDEGREAPPEPDAQILEPAAPPASSEDGVSEGQPPLEVGAIDCTVGNCSSVDEGSDHIVVDPGSSIDDSGTPMMPAGDGP